MSNTAELTRTHTGVDMCFPCHPFAKLFEVPEVFYRELDRFQPAGIDVVSMTVGLDHFPTIETVIREIALYRSLIQAKPDKYRLVMRRADIEGARTAGQTAVFFNFQGSAPLCGDLHLVETLRSLGLGQMLLCYNDRNLAGDGCHEPENAGLSKFGRTLVAEMNRQRMIVDLTHTGRQTTLDICAVSSAPTIYSHSNPRALYDHERNIFDDQIRACADTGGVIGINGVGLFLSGPSQDCSAARIVEHIDYVAQLVGVEHVGLGLDTLYNLDALYRIITAEKTRYASAGGYDVDLTKVQFTPQEEVPAIVDGLLARGYSEADAAAVLGGNFLRVIEQVWG